MLIPFTRFPKWICGKLRGSYTSQLSTCICGGFVLPSAGVLSPDMQEKILVKSQSFDAIMAELQAKSAFKDKGELFLCSPSSEGQPPLWVDSEEVF